MEPDDKDFLMGLVPLSSLLAGIVLVLGGLFFSRSSTMEIIGCFLLVIAWMGYCADWLAGKIELARRLTVDEFRNALDKVEKLSGPDEKKPQ